MDRGNRGSCIVGDPAGDDRHVNVLGLEPHYQIADVQGDINQQEVRSLAATQHPHGLFVVVRVRHGRAVVHRDLGGGRKLALQCANDEKPHGNLLFVCSRSSGLVSEKPSGTFRLDDFCHGHAKLVFHQHHLATRHQPVVDVYVDGFTDAAVKLEHGAGPKFQ